MTAPDVDLQATLVDGGAFIHDCPAHATPLWGRDGDILWAEGEALIICGPQGVGKTTLAGQVVGARLTGGQVLGLPVAPTDSRVLYLAMDRPKQIRRALRRTLRDLPRRLLDERLRVWQGPPPSDLARHPDRLLELAQAADADTVIVDSLKDAALGLSADEIGAAYNRARQLCLINGVEVLELHHMVKKGSNGSAPDKLEDVYGSVWLTSGAGSVLLLWGEAGDDIVSLRHLKQPEETVGPFKVRHDHATGTSVVAHQVDLVALAARADGVTARQAAVAMFEPEDGEPSDAQVEKARRKLHALAKKDGFKEARRAGQPTRWFAPDLFSVWDS